MKDYLLLVLLFTIPFSGQNQEQAIESNTTRKVTPLNGYWNYIVDPYENGFYNYRYEPFENQENPSKNAFFTNSKKQSNADLIEYDFDKMDSLLVPGDWNSQKEKLYYYEGSIWYKKSFNYSKSNASNRVFLHIGAANYKTDVYINGKKLGQHTGGFTPFQFEITSELSEKGNFIIIKVDNTRKKEGVPTLNTDWWNYGGITRDVKLLETSSTYISDHTIHLSKTNTKVIKAKVTLNGNARSTNQITLKIPELNINKTIETNDLGTASFELTSDAIKYWSPTSPTLYNMELSTDNDIITDTIGFRTIATNGSEILLNGKSIFLKGISIHEESPINGGRCNSPEDARKLLEWAQELGCNYVRLAHYPHNEYTIRLADKMGILIWEEIPVYWTINWQNKQTYANAQNQLSEVIERDKNRASVIIWSMANETPTSNARNTFLTNLARFTKTKDQTRLISAALEQHNYNNDPTIRTIEDPFAEVVDILSFNQYIGWYDGSIEKCLTINWKITQDKPVIISEFGAGAKYDLHGSKDERWTEEYQEFLYEETLKMVDKIDQLRGISPWVLVDFKSPRRVLPVIQDDYNRKGLISEKGKKKKAFYVLQKYYSKN